MLPVPSFAAKLIALSGLSIALAGVLLQIWPLAAAGTMMLLLLGSAFALTLPLGRRLRNEELEFGWWMPRTAPYLGIGQSYELRCYLRNRGQSNLRIEDIRAFVDPHKAQTPPPQWLRIAANTRANFSLALTTRQAGRIMHFGMGCTVRGALGLFSASVYFPTPLEATAFPARQPTRQRFVRTPPIEGARAIKAAKLLGTGIAPLELREYRPGDPFRNIAWKATAKTGRLVIREFEQEIPESHLLVVDMGPSTRRGAIGERPVDLALRECASLAESLLSRGASVGLGIMSERKIRWIKSEDRPHQMRAIREALLDGLDDYEEALSALTDREVAVLVATYLRNQSGVVIDIAGSDGPLRLASYVEKTFPSAAKSVEATTPEGMRLRTFCKQAGIVVPIRAEGPPQAWAEGVDRVVDTLSKSAKRGSRVTWWVDAEDKDWLRLRNGVVALEKRGLSTSVRLLPLRERRVRQTEGTAADVAREWISRQINGDIVRELRRVGIDALVTDAHVGAR